MPYWMVILAGGSAPARKLGPIFADAEMRTALNQATKDFPGLLTGEDRAIEIKSDTEPLVAGFTPADIREALDRLAQDKRSSSEGLPDSSKPQ